jgi:hypothetical protein
VDTLRLEVALVGGKEMFGWPGSKKFEDVDITEMVQRGAIGNGSFGLHARSVFGGRAATYQYRGEELLENLSTEKLVKWDYKVPRFLSGYSIRVGERKAIVGYHGAFWAEPKTLDLRRMDVIADDIPAELNLSAASDRIDYLRTKIGEGDFLLPLGSELHMVDLGGTENRNQIRFSACRQYSGESVISFADPAPEISTAPVQRMVQEVTLPPGLDFTLALTEAIELKTSAVGDAIFGRLQNDVKLKGRVLVPKGALASGRISTLTRIGEHVSLGMTFSEIATENIHAVVNLKLDGILGVSRLTERGTGFRSAAPNPGEGIVNVPATQPRILRGTLMYWRN